MVWNFLKKKWFPKTLTISIIQGCVKLNLIYVAQKFDIKIINY